MSTVTAIYENGVFRPLEKVTLPESSRVSVIVPDAAKPAMPPALAAVYEVLSRRGDSGFDDLAERHNEHQP